MVRVFALSVGIALFIPTVLRAQSTSARTAGTSVQPLLDQGKAALAQGDFNAASTAFSAALTTSPTNMVAVKGLGVAHFGLGEFTKAMPLFARAITTNSADRVAVYDSAAANLSAKTPMRSVKVLVDYLQLHSKQVDEPLADALAIVLSQVDDASRKSSAYETAANFSKSYNAKLEAAAPGFKRWGIDWYTAADYAQMEADVEAKQKAVDKRAADVAAVNKKLDSFNANYLEAKHRVETMSQPETSLGHYEGRLNEMNAEKERKLSAYEAAVADLPKPTYPSTLEAMTDDTIRPPTVNATPKTTSSALAASTEVSEIRIKGSHHDTPEIPVPADAGADAPPAVPEAVHKSHSETAVAFAIAPDLVVTSADVVKDATKIDLLSSEGNSLAGEVVRSDEPSGLALLRLTDHKLLYLPLASDFGGGAIQCGAIPKPNVFNATVEVLNGTAPAPSEKWKISLKTHPELPGAPLLVDGKVVGVQLGNPDAMPASLPAATLKQLRTFLGADMPASAGTGSATASLLQLTATKTN